MSRHSLLRTWQLLGLGLALVASANAADEIEIVFANRIPSVAPFSDSKTGFGLEAGSVAREGSNSITSDQPFLLSAKVPEGNYLVTAVFGDDAVASTNTVKAELRRLMVEQVTVPKGGSVAQSFVVNVRTPAIARGGNVRLKTREKESEMVNWDEKLTLEFNGMRPSLRALQIKRVEVPTIFLTGDSTVCDQPREPWNSWGQMLPRFFGAGVAVANYAQSGESIRSSLGARRFDKIFSLMKSNDWLFVQFGHNDMKDKATNALAVYKSNLKKIVARTRELGATPMLITSMERKAGVEHDTLEGYPQTVRDVAREDGVALIDLHATSKVLYRAWGANLEKAFQDGTHHNNYGSYELARCVVEGIRSDVPSLAKFLAADVARFDPAQPDAPDQFAIPASPLEDRGKPDGN
ncbi:MAG TPA: rhamnogalacturonan acetylesterase [Verrucomicrobiae bacterium]|nr:rhamnogalacturonan acetylesterase [Verrucomicrobiae bacterium]